MIEDPNITAKRKIKPKSNEDVVESKEPIVESSTSSIQQHSEAETDEIDQYDDDEVLEPTDKMDSSHSADGKVQLTKLKKVNSLIRD